jgi:hypothetical protein
MQKSRHMAVTWSREVLLRFLRVGGRSYELDVS